MDNYFKRIFDLYTSSSQSREMVNAFGLWLTDSSHKDKKENAMFELWKHTNAKMDRNDIDRSLNEVYQKAGRYNVNIPSAARKPVQLFRMLKYTAVITLFFFSVASTWYLTRKTYSGNGLTETYTCTGERKTFLLPDGSEVNINSSSCIIYPDKFNRKERTVFLTGEASFKVKKDCRKPFIVRSGDISVTAIGTEFNISAYPEDKEIITTLIEGKVKVECNNGEKTSYILNPGEQVTFTKKTGESEKNIADLMSACAWKEGVLVFSGVPLEDILQSLHRKYGIDFHVNPKHLNGDKYTLHFPENATIDTILGIIQKVIADFEYKISGNDCYIN